MDTTGKNTKRIAKYIKHNLKKHKAPEQMTLIVLKFLGLAEKRNLPPFTTSNLSPSIFLGRFWKDGRYILRKSFYRR